MKKLLRFISIVICIFCAINTLSAQDVGITSIVSPPEGYNILRNVPLNITIQFTNIGPATMTTADTIPFIVEMGDSSIVPLIIFFNSDVTAGSSGDLPVGLKFNIEGPITLCAYTMYPGDPDLSNDTSCRDYTVIPSGIDEPCIELSEVYFSNGNLHVKMFSTESNQYIALNIYNILGQHIATVNTVLQGNAENHKIIDLSTQPNGIYILNIYSEKGLVESKKFMLH